MTIYQLMRWHFYGGAVDEELLCTVLNCVRAARSGNTDKVCYYLRDLDCKRRMFNAVMLANDEENKRISYDDYEKISYLVWKLKNRVSMGKHKKVVGYETF